MTRMVLTGLLHTKAIVTIRSMVTNKPYDFKNNMLKSIVPKKRNSVVYITYLNSANISTPNLNQY